MSAELWVRVECQCGRVAAIPELGLFPICGGCGRRMIVPREGRVEMACEPGTTDEAVRRVRELNGNPPVGDGPIPGHARLYSDEALRERLTALGWPAEPCNEDWPKREMGDGARTRVAPWEA